MCSRPEPHRRPTLSTLKRQKPYSKDTLRVRQVLTVKQRILRRQDNEYQIQRILLRLRIDGSLFQASHDFRDIVRRSLVHHTDGIIRLKCDSQLASFGNEISAEVPKLKILNNRHYNAEDTYCMSFPLTDRSVLITAHWRIVAPRITRTSRKFQPPSFTGI